MSDLLLATWAAAAPGLLVAVLRTTDMVLATFRTVMVVSGRRGPASAIAFIEAAVILIGLAVALTDLTVARGIGYAAGMAAGTWLGMWAVHHLRLGIVTVRAFCPAGSGDLTAAAVRQLGYGATVFTGRGRTGPRDMVLCTVRRRHARDVAATLTDVCDAAMVTIDNTPAPGSRIGGIAGTAL